MSNPGADMLDFFRKLAHSQFKKTLGANVDVRNRLANLGDDGSSKRHVVHFAYPLRDSMTDASPEILVHLTEFGFMTRQTRDTRGFIFEHDEAIGTKDFDRMTEHLFRFFADLGWKYGGWECAISIPGEYEEQTLFSPSAHLAQ